MPIQRILMIAGLLGAVCSVLPLPALAAATSTPMMEKTIALTFDDGPYGTSTEKVLQILTAAHVHATFFLVGKNVEKYPQDARAIVADGETIGNHSYNHSKLLGLMSAKKFAANLNEAETIIASTTGVTPKLYRAPYGIVSTTMKTVLSQEGFTLEGWNDDPKDWNKNEASSTIIKKTLSEATPNTILILHDGRDTHIGYPRNNMLEALPVLIQDFKNEGYTFVTL